MGTRVWWDEDQDIEYFPIPTVSECSDVFGSKLSICQVSLDKPTNVGMPSCVSQDVVAFLSNGVDECGDGIS